MKTIVTRMCNSLITASLLIWSASGWFEMLAEGKDLGPEYLVQNPVLISTPDGARQRQPHEHELSFSQPNLY